MAIPSVTLISGSRATAATLGINADKRVIDMADQIFHLEADKNAVSLVASEMNKKSCFNPNFKWLEDELTPSITQLNASGITTTNTTLTVDHGSYGWANCLAQNQRTGEIVHITSVSSNEWTVTRSFGSTSEADMSDNDYFSILGGVAAEGASAETARSVKSATKSSYTQIFRSGFEVTNTDMASKMYGGPDLNVTQMLRGVEHAQYIEQAALWGEAAENTAGNTPRRSTDGINAVISTNSRDFNGGLSLVSLFDFMEEVNRYSDGTKLFVAGGAVISNVSLLAESSLRSVSKDDAFGLNVKRLVTPHGDLLIRKHNHMHGNENGRMFFILDINNLAYRYLQTRDTKLKTNIQANDADSREDEYITEAGFCVKQERTHGVGTNAASTATGA